MSVTTPTKADQPTSVETTDTEIFNGYTAPTALIPACSTYHPLSEGKGKGKEKSDTRWDKRANWKKPPCSLAGDCIQGLVAYIGAPPTPAPQMSRFKTSTPQEELKEWLYATHTNTYPRTKALVQSSRFTDFDLLATLTLALEQIRLAHHEIAGLVEYLAREPWYVRIANAAPEAKPDFLEMLPEHFEGVPRWGLEEDLVEAGVEVQYLGEVVGWLEWKVREAVEGS